MINQIYCNGVILYVHMSYTKYMYRGLNVFYKFATMKYPNCNFDQKEIMLHKYWFCFLFVVFFTFIVAFFFHFRRAVVWVPKQQTLIRQQKYSKQNKTQNKNKNKFSSTKASRLHPLNILPNCNIVYRTDWFCGDPANPLRSQVIYY